LKVNSYASSHQPQLLQARVATHCRTLANPQTLNCLQLVLVLMP
jgi:hypothetical protein